MQEVLQTDSLWAKEFLKGTKYTIGRWGCALSCLSMASDYFGHYQSPSKLASTFDFTPDGYMYWSSLNLLDLGFKLESRMNIVPTAIDGAWQTLKKYANDPLFVVMIQINGTHWVVTDKNFYDGIEPEPDDSWYDVLKGVHILDPIAGESFLAPDTKGKRITGLAVLKGNELPPAKPASDWAKKDWNKWVKDQIVTASDPKSTATKEWVAVVVERRLSSKK